MHKENGVKIEQNNSDILKYQQQVLSLQQKENKLWSK